MYINAAEISHHCEIFMMKRGLTAHCDMAAYPVDQALPSILNTKPMKSNPSFVPRLMRTEQASTYVGGSRILDLFHTAGWVRPAIQEHRSQVWDRYDLDEACDLLQSQGYETLQRDVQLTRVTRPQS